MFHTTLTVEVQLEPSRSSLPSASRLESELCILDASLFFNWMFRIVKMNGLLVRIGA